MALAAAQMCQFTNQSYKAVLCLNVTLCVPEVPERGEGRRRALDSMDEDDPNFLLAIQLSLQESRREQGLDDGLQRGMERRADLERGQEWRPGPMGDLGELTRLSVNTDGPPGARGPSLLAALGDPPRPPNRGDTISEPPRLNPLPLPPPPPSLSAMLLELEDSLMKLGNMATPFNPEPRTQEQLCSHHTHNHSTLAAPYAIQPPYSDCSHRRDPSAPTAPYVRERISVTDPSQQGYCHIAGCLAGAEGAASSIQTLTQPGLYKQEHAATYDRTLKADGASGPHPEHSSSASQEHPTACRSSKSDPQPPAHLCLLSPELEPELLLSPVIPPGGPYTPSDPQSLEPLDPTASAQLLDNIMAWFNSNINPQNNPQSLALIPSPPTTESDTSPDTHTETESESSRDVTHAPIWPPLGGEPESDRGATSCCLGAVGSGGQKTSSRPNSLDLGTREAGVEGADAGCVAELSLDEADAQPRSHSRRGNSPPAHPAPVTERDLDLILQLEGDQSPEGEWEEQVHLV